MRSYVLRYVYKPLPVPIKEEPVTALDDDEAARIAERRLVDLAYQMHPPPDGAIVLDAETHEIKRIIERKP